jgi:hypothetical protein
MEFLKPDWHLDGWKLEVSKHLTSVVERRFDEHTRHQQGDPQIAFCSFDSLAARRHLDSALIPIVVECGIGGGENTFDKLNFHTLPYPGRSSKQLWQDVESNPLKYDEDLLAKLDPGLPCGVLAQTLAKAAISTPFVGAFAGALALSEILRAYHGGPRVVSLDMHLRSLATMRVSLLENHDLNLVAKNGFTDTH